MTKITNIQVSGINTHDYPDFVDAYISSAEHEDGTPLTDTELDELNEDRGLVYEAVIERLY